MSEPYVYRYEVTHSTVPTVPVGSMLVDRYRDRFHTWNIINVETGEESSFTGKRVGERLCPTCYRQHKKATLYAHDGSHEAAPTSLPSATTEPPKHEGYLMECPTCAPVLAEWARRSHSGGAA